MKSIVVLLIAGNIAAYCSAETSSPELREMFIIATIGCLSGAVIRLVIYFSERKSNRDKNDGGEG